MAVYENPQNGHREEVGFGDTVGGCLLGPIWFLIRGAIGAGLGLLLLSLVFGAVTFGVGAVICWFIAAAMAQHAIGRRYLHAGWRRVDAPAPQPLAEPATLAPAIVARDRREIRQLREVLLAFVLTVILAGLLLWFGTMIAGVMGRPTGDWRTAVREVAQPAPELWQGYWPFRAGVVTLGCDWVGASGQSRSVWVEPDPRWSGERVGLNAPGRNIHGDARPLLSSSYPDNAPWRYEWIDAGLALCNSVASEKRYRAAWQPAT